jgi:hypothetical protein
VAATRKCELPGAFEPRGYVPKRSRSAGAACYCCVPPYEQLSRCVTPRDLRQLPRGSIVLIGDRLSADVGYIAAAAPAALIVVAVAAGETIGLTEFEELRWAGAAAMVALDGHGANPEILRLAARAASASVRGQLGPRLRLLGHPLPPNCESALEQLVREQPSVGARQWAAALGASVRALERRCAEHWHVPTPRRWIELVQVIHAVQAVQTQRERSVEWTLTAAGLTNVRTARELIKKVSHTTPTHARGLIGWYWIVEAWCENFW